MADEKEPSEEAMEAARKFVLGPLLDAFQEDGQFCGYFAGDRALHALASAIDAGHLVSRAKADERAVAWGVRQGGAIVCLSFSHDYAYKMGVDIATSPVTPDVVPLFVHPPTSVDAAKVRSEALEEAAMVCRAEAERLDREANLDKLPISKMAHMFSAMTANDCAEAIRGLQENETPPPAARTEGASGGTSSPPAGGAP